MSVQSVCWRSYFKLISFECMYLFSFTGKVHLPFVKKERDIIHKPVPSSKRRHIEGETAAVLDSWLNKSLHITIILRPSRKLSWNRSLLTVLNIMCDSDKIPNLGNDCFSWEIISYWDNIVANKCDTGWEATLMSNLWPSRCGSLFT